MGLDDRVPIRVGTLSKAIGSLGGFIAGPQVVIDYLINRARPLIYSTALPEAIAALSLEHLTLLRDGQHLRARLRAYEQRLQDELKPFKSATSDQPDCADHFANECACHRRSASTARRRVLCASDSRPDGASGYGRLRISVSAGHTDEDLDGLITACDRVPLPCKRELPQGLCCFMGGFDAVARPGRAHGISRSARARGIIAPIADARPSR